MDETLKSFRDRAIDGGAGAAGYGIDNIPPISQLTGKATMAIKSTVSQHDVLAGDMRIARIQAWNSTLSDNPTAYREAYQAEESAADEAFTGSLKGFGNELVGDTGGTVGAIGISAIIGYNLSDTNEEKTGSVGQAVVGGVVGWAGSAALISGLAVAGVSFPPLGVSYRSWSCSRRS